MKTLIPMVEFVLEQTEQHRFKDDCEFAYKVRKYAKFLSQPLELGFFVPCDEDGNVLKEPKTPWQDSIMHEGVHEKYRVKLNEYQKSKEKVLFEGFEFLNSFKWGFEVSITIEDYYQELLIENPETVENLLNSNIQAGFILTDLAIKQLGL